MAIAIAIDIAFAVATAIAIAVATAVVIAIAIKEWDNAAGRWTVQLQQDGRKISLSSR